MWRSIQKFMLWIIVIGGILISLIISAGAGGAGFVMFLCGIAVTLMMASSWGMLIEMAENIEKIEMNTRKTENGTEYTGRTEPLI